MKIKTSELSGVALDWAVAQCLGHKVIDNYGTYIRIHLPDQKQSGFSIAFCPTTDWSLGGPIIEREINKLWRNMAGTYGAQIKYRAPYYSPTYGADIGRDDFINSHGETPLIAAMRCYVAHKLGDEVDVPEELA